MTTYATATDVTDRLGKPADTDLTTLINTRLGDVERMIRREFTRAGKDFDALVTSTDLDVADVIQVEADAVLRLARNPEGFFSETDGNYTYQFRQDLSTGVVEVLPTEWDTLGVTFTGMFVIVPNPVVAT